MTLAHSLLRDVGREHTEPYERAARSDVELDHTADVSESEMELRFLVRGEFFEDPSKWNDTVMDTCVATDSNAQTVAKR